MLVDSHCHLDFDALRSDLDGVLARAGEAGVGTMVTACANCRINLEEGLEENNVEIEVIGLTETLADHLA